MLLSCPDCRGKVSMSAAACPHCGSTKKGHVNPYAVPEGKCPNCKGFPNSIEKINFGHMLMGGIVGTAGKSFICNHCGYKW